MVHTTDEPAAFIRELPLHNVAHHRQFGHLPVRAPAPNTTGTLRSGSESPA